MTKYEMLERRINSIKAEIEQAKRDGTGDKQYAECNYLSKRCNELDHHKKEGHEPWDSFVRLAKGLFGVKNVSSLRIEHAEICKNYINELIAIHNKYEHAIGAYQTMQSGYIKKLPYSFIERELDGDNDE